MDESEGGPPIQAQMHASSEHAAASCSAPLFMVMERQRVRPVAWLLAIAVSALVLTLLAFGLAHSHGRSLRKEMDRVARGGSASADADDGKDDPNQVDVVYLGDAADAPEPTRRSGHYRAVHPTIAIRLPRFGKDAGLIPDSGAGRLLYQWLAAFNRANAPALSALLPENAVETQMQLRAETGGFRLLSAAEPTPGVIVFRLQDQTKDAHEALGTLALRKGSNPATIASFSLRGLP